MFVMIQHILNKQKNTGPAVLTGPRKRKVPFYVEVKMRKLKEFIKDTQKYGITYALCWLFDLPYLFEESKNSKLRNFSYKC